MAQMAKDTSPERTLLAALCAVLLLCGAAPGAEVRLPSSALVLFGAHWCVPCRVEIAQLDPLNAALDEAGAPRRLVLAWIDRPALGAEAAQRHRATLAPPAEAANWSTPLLARAHGLPFAAMTDAAGQICALHAGPADPATIRTMRAACPAP